MCKHITLGHQCFKHVKRLCTMDSQSFQMPNQASQIYELVRCRPVMYIYWPDYWSGMTCMEGAVSKHLVATLMLGIAKQPCHENHRNTEGSCI